MNSVQRGSTRRPVVRLAPEEWGYGPLGNALHLARVMRAIAGDAVILEIVLSDTFRGPVVEGVFDRIHSNLASADIADAVVTVMNVDGIISASQRNEKVYAVDALAWLWTDPLPIHHLIHTYFYQNLKILPVPSRNFEKMPNATPISAIGSLPPNTEDNCNSNTQAGIVVSLSGLETPSSRSGQDTLWYPPYILNAFEELVSSGRIDPSDLALFGNTEVLKRFAGPNLIPAIRADASQSEFAKAARAAGSVVCSPGLTTIVECLRAGIGLRLLPAQNFGQVKQMNAFVSACGMPAMPWTGAALDWLQTATLSADVRSAIMRGIIAEARIKGGSADPEELRMMLQSPAPIPNHAAVEELIGIDDGALEVARSVLEDLL
jgi:hypothetical protein